MYVIGIAGGTGSGKTTVVNKILEAISMENVGVIAQDCYYKTTNHLTHSERCSINFDHPEAIDFDLLVQHIQELKAGNSIPKPVYSFVEHNRTNETLTIFPKKVLIVEGILVMAHKKLRDAMDVKIFIETDTDERLIRRLKRDINERGRDFEEVLNRYQETLKPMHNKYISPTKAFADIIITNNVYNSAAIDMVKALIEQKMQ